MSIATDLDVLIIGGGISGLASGWYLAQSGLKIQVWEQSERPGGKIQTDHCQGFQTERAASMIMNFKPEVDQFFHQTGMEQYRADRLLRSQSKRYLIHQGKLESLPMTIGGLFFSSLWSTSGKFRLLAEPFIGRSNKTDETVSEFISRRLGREFLEKAMEPFISGTLASDPDNACARYVIPRLTALEQRFGSITAGITAHKITGTRTARNPESFSFNDGMESLPRRLARLPAMGFKAAHRVTQLIRHSKDHWEVTAQCDNSEHSLTAKHVIISTPSFSAAEILRPIHEQLSSVLQAIDYAPLSVVHLGFERSGVHHPLNSSGFLVPRQENMAINGNLWMSSIFAGRAPDNQLLLSSYLGGSRHPDDIHLSSQASIERVLSDIKPLLGITQAPIMARVDKHQQALPLYSRDYCHKLTAIEQYLHSLPGLHLEANYIGGVSIRDRIVSARQKAHTIISELNPKSSIIHSTPTADKPLIETIA